MITKTLDDVMRKILNDPDIFYYAKIIFDKKEWKGLETEYLEYEKSNDNNLTDKINQKIRYLENELNSEEDKWKKNTLKRAIELTNALKKAINKKPFVLAEMFSTLDTFSLVKCNLPNMEDYGKVIENHNRSTVEQFFLHKIDKAKGYEKKALRKALEYLKELYAMNLDILEIAFFFRKLNSLTQFTEVIKDE